MTIKQVKIFTTAVVLATGISTSASAAAPASAQKEIEYLLGFVGSSGCKFYRNGTWYDAGKGQEHLRSKYEYLAKRNQVSSAEDFIGKAATGSSLSGKPYRVQCANSAPLSSSQWLREELAHYRAAGSSADARGRRSAGFQSEARR
jgi:hypothetical protein